MYLLGAGRLDEGPVNLVSSQEISISDSCFMLKLFHFLKNKTTLYQYNMSLRLNC